MKLLMFAPGLRSSAIGRVTKLVVDALARRDVECVIVRTESGALLDAPMHPYRGSVLRWDDDAHVAAAASTCDIVIYHIGNHYDFHRGGVEWMSVMPGVVCLHDYFLGHLFWGWADCRRAAATGILRTWYGDDVANSYFTFRNPAEFVEGTHRTAPMVEWVAAMADAVITHSGWDIQRVLDACPGPVRVAALPYDAPGAEQTTAPSPLRAVSPFRVLTFGDINPNKRVESVIRAIGGRAVLRRHTQYRLVGRIEPDMAASLSGLAGTLGVNLSISGEVDEVALPHALREADVVCCLRLPSLEAASASAVEAMLYGKALIVMDVASYGEIPDECVRKVAPHEEVAGIGRELEHLYWHPARRHDLGSRARAWASVTHSAESYAERLIDISGACMRAAPLTAAIRDFATTLAGWQAESTAAAHPLLVEPLEIFTAPESSR